MTVAELIKELETVQHPEAVVELHFHHECVSGTAHSVGFALEKKPGDAGARWVVFISTGKGEFRA